MKLEDWLIDGHAIRDPAGLHVIGTCGKCKYFDDWEHCASPDMEAFIEINLIPNFGCIHFEQKEGS